MLLCALLACGVAGIVFLVIGVIEGVVCLMVYLMKTDQEFVDTDILGKKGWF